MIESKKVWKYSTFGLLAILAVGISFPQALGDIQNNINHMLTHIYNFTDGIEAKTNNLPSDPASNTVVNTRASQASVNNLQTTVNSIKTETDSLPSDPASQSALEDSMLTQIITTSGFTLSFDQAAELECISDGPFIAHIIASGTGDPVLFIEVSPKTGNLASISVPVPGSYTVGGDDTMMLEVTGQTDSNDTMHIIVTFQTTQGATASCSF